MKDNSPYQYWTKTKLAEQLISLSFAFDMTKEIRHLIEEAINSRDWDALVDFKGCSVLQEMYYPSISCFLYNYLIQTGQGGVKSNRLFYYLMLEEGVQKTKAKKRWLLFRIIWLLLLKWKYVNKRNLKPYGGHFLTTLNKLEIKYKKK